jgi:hypothetical protein
MISGRKIYSRGHDEIHLLLAAFFQVVEFKIVV